MKISANDLIKVQHESGAPDSEINNPVQWDGVDAEIENSDGSGLKPPCVSIKFWHPGLSQHLTICVNAFKLADFQSFLCGHETYPWK